MKKRSASATSGDSVPKKAARKKKSARRAPHSPTNPGTASRSKKSRKAEPAAAQQDDPAAGIEIETPARRRREVPHCNNLDGKRWLQNSISVWSDIRKSADEARLKHPAMFPGMLVDRLIETFMRPDSEVVLDPFCGTGSTLLGAERCGRRGIGIELSPEYAALARQRLNELRQDLVSSSSKRLMIHEASVSDLPKLVPPESVDFCLTSPPYWDILNQRRTADGKDVRHYGNRSGDLGTISDYQEFLDALKTVFQDVFVTLKPGAYCAIIVMDLRKKNCFFPLHSDLATRLIEIGYIFDDLIVWNRQSEYNNLRPLGYPAVFRVNKVHEFIVLMQKPRQRT